MKYVYELGVYVPLDFDVSTLGIDTEDAKKKTEEERAAEMKYWE